MSSRALRKAQRQKDLQDFEKDEESFDESEQKPSATKQSLFSLLSESNDDPDVDSNDELKNSGANEASVNGKQHEFDSDESTEETVEAVHAVEKSHRKKKKKTKSKKKSKHSLSTQAVAAPSHGLDEIDLALKSLSTTGPEGGEFEDTQVDSAMAEVCRLLSVDFHHLSVANEMKRLFGRAAFAIDNEESGGTGDEVHDTVGLKEAVSGRNSRAGAGLTAAIRRRNIFSPGKEEWPKAPGGGLGMEIVEKCAGGMVEYRFTHNVYYQRTQDDFDICVQSMVPTAMVNLLRLNPYHISTLLQVSEMARQGHDHSTSADLLERALFSFGRALHSTFASNLAQGKARLDFRRPENREFWLTVWRYIANISMRATWRTAYEWTRLLLSLDPEHDPYCVCLVIDQFALRSRQGRSFLELVQSSFFQTKWAHLPNIQTSTILAHRQVQDYATSRLALEEQVKEKPWLFSRLYQELGIEHVPPSIWGNVPSTPQEHVYAELYATQAKDLWKLPEVRDFLVNTVKGVEPTDAPQDPSNSLPVTLDEARFLLLTEKQPLISLIPPSILSKIDSTSDPLPPKDNLPSYHTSRQERSMLQGQDSQHSVSDGPLPTGFAREIIQVHTQLENLFSESTSIADSAPAEVANPDPDNQLARDIVPDTMLDSEAEFESEREQMPPEAEGLIARLVALRRLLLSRPAQTGREDDGTEVQVMPDGNLRIVFADEEAQPAPSEGHDDANDI